MRHTDDTPQGAIFYILYLTFENVICEDNWMKFEVMQIFLDAGVVDLRRGKK